MLRMAVLRTWTGLALAAGLVTGAWAAEAAKESPASEQLAQQARYWEGQNRYDLARENWLKLLRSSPDSASALAGLANAEAVSGRAAAAQVYLDRLKESHPDHPDLRRIEAAIRQGSINQDQLNQPRTLARQGKYQEAIDAYRASFGKEIPSGRLGLEYYQTLAGTEDGWEPAKEGIERLAKENGNDGIYQLALAQHLTYREGTRRQGITQLAALAQQPSIAAPAKQAWRQSLLWLGAKRGDEALYQDYLKRYGEDAQVSARLASIRQGVAVAARGDAVAQGPREPTTAELRGKVIRQGFEALDNGQMDIAVERFDAATAEFGPSADALGGLGIVQLRQQNYGEARVLLERATAMDRKTSARWSEALSTARFWDSVRSAEATRKAGDNAQAERELRRAIAADPKRAATEVSVPLSLADVLVEQGQITEAEKIYRDVLRRAPDNVDALRGLIGVLTRTKRLPEAIALADRQPPEIRNQLGSFGVIKAQGLREQAALAITARDDARAEILLKEALLLDPESPWTRLDLARIYQRQNRVREANTLVDAMLSASGPVQPDVVVIKASLLAEQQDFLAGLQMLEQIPVGSRTPDMTELQKRLWVRYQTQRAGVFSRAGAQAEAQQILSEVEPFVGEMPELLGAMAGAYADLGDESRALRYMRQALARNSQSDAGLRLGYASLLFKLRQDTEFEVVMDDLLRRGGLNEQQNLDLANLRIGYRLRQADLVREEGDLARAYEYLEPLIRVNPNDPRLMMALARLYNDSKDFDKAYVIYERVLQQNGEEVDAYKGAIGAALAMNRVDEADAMLERAFAVDANNPRLYALAGRAAKARGDSGRALGLYQQALRLDAEQNAQSATASPSGSGNSQPLLQMIDPSSSYLRAPPRVTGALSSPEPQLRSASAGSFFKTSRASAAPRARPVWLQRAQARQALVKAAARGDIALPAGYRLKVANTAGFVKVSTPVVAEPAAPVPRSSGDRPTGYWTEQPRSSTAAPSYKYVESLSIQQMGRPSTPQTAAPSTAAPLPAYRSDFPPPRRSTPTMSQKLSRPSGSLGEELRGEIDSVGGNLPPGSYTTAPRRSGVYEVPRLQEGYTVPYGGTVDYVPPPPPSTIRSAPRSVVVSDDPMLATPEFAIDRNRADSKDRKELLKEISELRASRTPYAQAGLTLRTRDGSAGLDKLYNVESPVEVAFPATDAGRFKVRAVPVYLDAGTVSGASLPVYGGLGLALATGVAAPTLRYDNSESGIAVGVGYEAGDFKADFGSSPLGFPVETLVGGVNWRPKADNVSFKIDLARRSVTDSLLSYAGLRDPATGLTYGGVTKTGGRLDAALDLGKYGLYANGGYNIYDGQNVPQNNSVELGAGLYARAIETRSNRVTYGLNITGFGYEKNLRRFSFGHGGYFSPQSYLAISVPVEWEGYRNRFSYKLGGALGIQSFKEDGQAQYPNDSGLQAALETALEDYDGTVVIPGGYNSQNQTGVGFTLGGQFEYLLDPNLALGTRVALDNARDYNEASASAYLRYMFYPQKRVSFPPNLLLPNFNFGDPRL